MSAALFTPLAVHRKGRSPKARCRPHDLPLKLYRKGLLNAINIIIYTIAREGPRRNQFTGPIRPKTPPKVSHDTHEASLPSAKRRKPNKYYEYYDTP